MPFRPLFLIFLAACSPLAADQSEVDRGARISDLSGDSLWEATQDWMANHPNSTMTLDQASQKVLGIDEDLSCISNDDMLFWGEPIRQMKLRCAV